MRKFFCFLWALTLCSGFLLGVGRICLAADHLFSAEDMFSAEDLFSADDYLVDEEEVVSAEVGAELNTKRVEVTGQAAGTMTYLLYSPSHDWFGPVREKYGPSREKHGLENLVAADFFVDIRLKDGIKSFLSLGVDYYPAGREKSFSVGKADSADDDNEWQRVSASSDENTEYRLKEFFIDTNWRNKIYFRTGKQVLKWGRSYFWNPTDLINVEKKDFFDLEKTREGTYGTKIHLPFGAAKNIYVFVGMDDAKAVQDLSVAGKYEFLVGGTEMAFSAWTKKGHEPVYGYDISGRLFDLDLRGEMSLSRGRRLDPENLGCWQEEEEWIPKISAGFTKYFDHGEIKDRISVTGEFYYNHAGYDENIFAKHKAPTKTELDLFPKVYEPYMTSKYYLAFFTSVNKFIRSELTLNLNGMMNLVDNSAILSTGLSYSPALTDLTIDLTITGRLGEQYSEATFMGDRLSLSLGTKILF
ncbi:MAG TPA: hypothetical protein GXZ36_09565 [Firmicutes bacterium]|nr:hypothetical protein [Bacillota bacterium]